MKISFFHSSNTSNVSKTVADLIILNKKYFVLLKAVLMISNYVS
jgi:hypothetical protein